MNSRIIFTERHYIIWNRNNKRRDRTAIYGNCIIAQRGREKRRDTRLRSSWNGARFHLIDSFRGYLLYLKKKNLLWIRSIKKKNADWWGWSALLDESERMGRMLLSLGAGVFSPVEAQGTKQERRTTAAGPQHLLQRKNPFILRHAAG